jgi:CheY-like chemotaxis protein
MSRENIKAKIKILLVEDSEPDIYLFRRALKQAKIEFDLTVIRNGNEASDFVNNPSRFLKGDPFNLAVLDLNLPGDSGLAILKAIRKIPELKSFPVAVMTSSESLKERHEAEQLGADRFILKPHGLEGVDKVVATLKELLSSE